MKAVCFLLTILRYDCKSIFSKRNRLLILDRFLLYVISSVDFCYSISDI